MFMKNSALNKKKLFLKFTNNKIATEFFKCKFKKKSIFFFKYMHSVKIYIWIFFSSLLFESFYAKDEIFLKKHLTELRISLKKKFTRFIFPQLVKIVASIWKYLHSQRKKKGLELLPSFFF